MRDPRAAPRGRPLLFLLLVAAAAGAALLLRRPGERPSVLLVTLDTTRFDAVGEGTPALAALARGGVRFLNARSPVPLTLPAHATLLSGLLPPRHGLRDNASPPLPASRAFPLLAEEFSGAGYATAAFVASGVLDPRYGLDAGFSRYDRPAPGDPGEPRFRELGAEEQASRAEAWLRSRPEERPFFLWVHFFDPHEPYEAWAGDGARSATDDSDPAAERYRGEVRRVDAAVERLLRAIPGGTVVVVAGDHGESLGEHEEPTHGHLLHGAALRVPLLLRGPGVPEGREDARACSLEDVAPTIRALCRLEAREGDGADLLAPDPRRVVTGESLLPSRAYGWAQQTCAFDGRHLLLDGGPRLEIYDVAADPGERAPLKDPSRQAAYERLDRALQEYRALRPPALEGAPVEALTPYGSDRIGVTDFLSPAENRARPDVRGRLPTLAPLYGLIDAIARRDQPLARHLLAAAAEAEARDPGNPAFPLQRGRALLLLLDRPGEASDALGECWRRGYRNPGVARLRLEALARTGGRAAAEEFLRQAAEALGEETAAALAGEFLPRFR